MDELETQFNSVKAELDQAKLENMQLKTEFGKSSYFNAQEKSSLINEQTDPDSLLDRLYHELSSHVLERNEKGDMVWKSPKNKRLIILTDYGVGRLMNIASMYVNTHMLFSNHDNDQINFKMKCLSVELTDFIEFEYRDIFYFTTTEEYYKKFMQIIRENSLDKKYESVFTEERVRKYCELKSELDLNKRINNFFILLRSMVDLIHSQYLRSLNGEERKSARENHSVIESTSNSHTVNPPSNKFRLFKPSTW